MHKTNYVRASEISEYVYCKRGWWLRYNGLLKGESEAMIQGTEGHKSLAQSIEQNTKARHYAVLLIKTGLFLLVIALLILFFL